MSIRFAGEFHSHVPLLIRCGGGLLPLSCVAAFSTLRLSNTTVVPSAKPLERFPFVPSRDVEAVSDAIESIYARPLLVPARGVEGFNATINVCNLNNVGLAYGAFGGGVGFDFPASGFFSQLFPIRGKGEIVCGQATATLSPGSSAIVSADWAHKANYSADYEHLILRISAHALTKKLTAMTGATINELLRMDSPQSSRHPAARMLQQCVPLFIEMLSDAGPPSSGWTIAQTEQVLMTLFLCGHRHNYSHLVEREAPDAALRQVRRAEEYIEANAQQAVTLEELAEVTGASAFSLFRGFRKHRGYSPLEFLAQVRSKPPKS